MTVTVDYKENGWLKPSKNIHKITPGVSGTVKKNIQLGNRVIPKGPVIIQPTDDPSKFKITTFKSVKSTNPDLPESHRDIKPDETHEVILESPSKYLEFNDEQYARTTQNLFTHEITIEDIHQGRIPDCFLLAAIASIVNHPHGDSFIRSMMKDNDDGTITVRLYNPNTLQPIFINVDKSYIIDQQGALSDHKALWPMILEKAYLGLADTLEKNDISTRSVYSGGGPLKVALAALTGLKINYTMLEENQLVWDIKNHFKNEILQIEGLLPIKDQMSGNFDEIVDSIFASKKFKPLIEIFKDKNVALEKTKELLFFYIEHKEMWNEIVTTTPATLNELAALITHLREINPETQDYSSIINTLDKLKEYYYIADENNRVRVEMPTYSGIYSPYEMKVFDKLKQGLDEGQLITAGTYSKAHYSKEELNSLQGLRAHHAYTVVDVFEKKMPIPGETEMQTMYFVQLRNPWGHTGRIDLPDMETGEYTPTEVRAAGTFNLPLKDFCKLFEDYARTPSVSKTFQLAANKEQVVEKTLDILKNWPEDILNIDHLEIKSLYDKFIDCKNLIQSNANAQLDLLNEEDLNKLFFILDNHELDEQQKHKEVNAMVDINKFLFIEGDEEEAKDYIYQLVLHRWHDKNNTITPEIENDFEKVVMNRHAHLAGAHWLALEENIASLHLQGCEVIKTHYPKLLENALAIIDTLKELSTKIPAEDGQMRKLYLETYFLTFEHLQLNVKSIFELQALASKLGIHNFDAQTQQLDQELNYITERSESLKESPDARLIAKNAINNTPKDLEWKDAQNARQAIQEMLSATGVKVQTFKPQTAEQVVQQEELLGFIGTIKNAFKNLGQLIAKLFKKKQTSYEIETNNIPIGKNENSLFAGHKGTLVTANSAPSQEQQLDAKRPPLKN